MRKFFLLMLLSAVFFTFCENTPDIDEPEPQRPEPEELLAFPGAEGHGRYVTGGRGGDIYYVTTLADYDRNQTPIPGSLRYGIDREDKRGQSNADRYSPRTILFNVSGTIFLERELRMPGRGNLTIAGQSAPDGGICIASYSTVVNNTENIIIRFVRFRLGDVVGGNDGSDAIWGRYSKNIILDHCSMSWGIDECASFYGNENFTMQWCIISESLNWSLHSKGAHGYGGIWGGISASFHHNLMAHHQSRTPRFSGNDLVDLHRNKTDYRNNVYYNYNGNGAHGGEQQNGNIVNNYYIPGAAWTQNFQKKGRIAGLGKGDAWGTWFIEGNIVEDRPGVFHPATNDNWNLGVYNQIAANSLTEEDKIHIRRSTPLDAGIVTTHTTQKALDQVVSYAGASLLRDTVDNRIIEEVIFRRTTYMGPVSKMPGIIDSVMDLKPANAGSNWLPWPDLGSAIIDNEALINEWLEENHPGKTPNDFNEVGYTYLEVYLNSLVESIIKFRNE